MAAASTWGEGGGGVLNNHAPYRATSAIRTYSAIAMPCDIFSLSSQVLDAFKAGAPVPMNKWGSKPMNGQLSCEGPLGKTSLKAGDAREPCCRDLPKKVDPQTVKAHMMY